MGPVPLPSPASLHHICPLNRGNISLLIYLHLSNLFTNFSTCNLRLIIWPISNLSPYSSPFLPMWCIDPVSRHIPCWAGTCVVSLCTGKCHVLVKTHQWPSEMKQKVVYVNHTRCRAPGPPLRWRLGREWGETTSSLHDHHLSTTSSATVPGWSQWDFV